MSNLTDAFEITSLSRQDLLQLEDNNGNPKYTPEYLETIDDSDMKRIASKMADDYCEQLYWSSLDIIAESVLGK